MTHSFWPRVAGATLLLAALALAGCTRGDRPNGNDNENDGRPDTVAAGDTAKWPPFPIDTTPLSAADTAVYYHLSEGSEMIPVIMLLALNNPATGRPLLADPERFGLLPDARSPTNPYGLPVGLTADTSVDTHFLGLELQGFNCAGCHVGELRYQGNRLRVLGGQSLFAPVTLMTELGAAIQQVVSNPFTEWGPFLRRYQALEREFQPRRRLFTDTRLVESLSDGPPTAGERAVLEAVRASAREDSAGVAYDDRGEPEPVVSDTGGAWSQAAADSLGARVLGRLPDAQAQALRQRTPSVRGPGAQSLERQLGNVGMIIRMLESRLATVRSLVPLKGQTDAGFGRVDAFGVARNRLFPRDTVNQNAPVSFPHLWDLNRTVWLHYDANTNSVMERNLGQALGMGAGMDNRTWRSTLNPVHLHRLEMLSRRTRPPAWPAFFPAVDTAKAARGRRLYGENCAGCHVETPNDLCFDADSIGTDPVRIRNFSKPMRNGVPFTTAVSPILHDLKREAYDVFDFTPEQRREHDGGMTDAQIVWRTTRMYGVRPLGGIWATAPYLHNGSVPTLWDLLLPAARRPRRFALGTREYDPVKLGFRTEKGPWQFDVTQPGNGNGGHEYGTSLTDAERWDLLEYLKVHTTYTGPAPRPAWVRQCPRGDG